MIYAPVIIPTLNRYVHLERLVESLKKNSFAKETELYISVDYPPSEKYREGYEKLCAYVKTINGFKTVNLFFQSENLGVYDNVSFLINKISEKYDRYICTEDDNEFSPCYLEYVDKCLERFQYDLDIMSVAAVEGLNPNCQDDKYTSNYVIKNRTSPYGYATWIYKEKNIDSYNLQRLFSRVINSNKLQWELFKVNGNALTFIAHDLMGEIPAMRDSRGNLTNMDYNKHIYYILNKKYAVFPVENMVRNWGYDGSGLNCSTEIRTAEETGKIPLCQLERYSFIEPLYTDIKIWDKNDKYFSFFRDITLKDAIRSFLIIRARRTLSDKGFEKFKKVIKRNSTGDQADNAI